MKDDATLLEFVQEQIEILSKQKNTATAFADGERIYYTGLCQTLSISKNAIDVLVQTDSSGEAAEISLKKFDKILLPLIDGQAGDWDASNIAALLQAKDELELPNQPAIEGKAYTREGMVKRVLAERKEKAIKSGYRIKFATNIFGEHEVTNEKGVKFQVLLRDFENETGYINNPDWQTNKLGTTKHIMFAFETLKENKKLYNKLSKTFPFVEIYTDPQNDYQITWHYPHVVPAEINKLLKAHFGKKKFITKENETAFLGFIEAARNFAEIKIRPEVDEKVSKAWDTAMLQRVEAATTLNFDDIKAELFPYQKKGVQFATFKDAVIIADEMGLGKTIQAITIAIKKKQVFGFKKTLVVCPASLKEQWKKEIEKFCDEEAVVVDGLPAERNAIYSESTAYFLIVNYETVLRDLRQINKMDTDFVILDEAQRIKNFSTTTAQNIKQLKKKHGLVITGTPIENKISDLYSIVQFVDPNFLSPLWEFSYQHCLFDERNRNKITGYYNLQNLYERLQPILLRREKRTVIKDLPTVTEINVPVSMQQDQQGMHASFAQGIATILGKKYISPYDQQKLMLLLLSMRMCCDSTFLIDKETHVSPKLEELKYILTEKMELAKKPGKVIIFSEWVVMLQLIGQMLHKEGIGYAMLNGKVAVKNRGQLVKKFETDPDCKIFLSSEAGGSGLNLQVADTVINFELPWNPAKKNQRIGRIDRLGQRSKKLTVINFITRNSIETQIASGLGVKQSLFDGVLSESNRLDSVDFSASGRAQFLLELEAAMAQLANPAAAEIEELFATEQEVTEAATLTGAIKEEVAISEPAATITEAPQPLQQMEKVMQNGLDFLAGIYQMATGKSMGADDKSISIDEATGEVVMRFKFK
jgi:SNF2-related domain/Helicase conserved C-terminal domain